MTIYTSSNAKKQVGKLFQLYDSGQVNETTARNLNKILELEINQLQIDLSATEKDLGEFEHQYSKTTADFSRQWQAGEIDDRMDYVEWASLAQMADNLRERLEFLTSENQEMNIAEYFKSVKDRILTDSFVIDFKILKYVDRSNNGHMRARVIFSDDSNLEFSEFIEQSAENEIRLVTYSYQWVDENNNLIRRWDNALHFPKLKNAPHHIHTPISKTDEEVTPGALTNIFAVLDEIVSKLRM